MLTALRKPSFYAALLALAALVNLAGYLFSLWHEETIFDEAVHAFTSFALVAAIGRARAARTRTLSVWAQLGIALVLGVAWEVFEWMVGMIGTMRDTAIDLAMDAAGGLAAGWFVTAVMRGRIRAP